MADYITTLDQTDNILWQRPSAVEDLTLNHLQVSKIFSFTGTKESSKRYVDGIGMSLKYTYQLDRDDSKTMLNFWQERNGQYEKFYLPLYENYFTLVQNVALDATILYIKHLPYVEQWILNTYILLDMNNGDRIVRKVVDYQTSTDYDIMTLDSGVPYNISTNDIGLFGRLILVHFASDDYEIDYTLKDFHTVTLLFHEIITTDTEDEAIYAELYTITTPLGTTYYTSYYKDIVLNNITYIASVIKRDQITYSLDLSENNTLNISVLPTDYVKQNIFSQPLTTITISITRLNITTGDTTAIYKGHLTGISMQDDTAVLNLQAKDEVLGFNVPKIVYQSTCNNSLYDDYCKVASANFSETGTITEVSDSTIVSPTFANREDGFFTMGYAKYYGEYRLITNHVGDTLTLLQPFSDNVLGKSIIAYAGCDKSADTCKNKFNNILNFRGFAYIPNKNPSIWGLL